MAFKENHFDIGRRDLGISATFSAGFWPPRFLNLVEISAGFWPPRFRDLGEISAEFWPPRFLNLGERDLAEIQKSRWPNSWRESRRDLGENFLRERFLSVNKRGLFWLQEIQGKRSLVRQFIVYVYKHCLWDLERLFVLFLHERGKVIWNRSIVKVCMLYQNATCRENHPRIRFLILQDLVKSLTSLALKVKMECQTFFPLKAPKVVRLAFYSSSF